MSPVEKITKAEDARSKETAAQKAAQEMVDRAGMKHAPTPVPAGTAKPLAEHTVKAGETLSGIAMQYYKSADKEKWMKIFEANKAIIGENPNVIKAGLVLKIPAL